MSIVLGFPGGMSISNISSGGSLEVSIVFFDVEDVGFMGLEGSSLSLSFGSIINLHSSLEDLNHILGGLFGFSGGI